MYNVVDQDRFPNSNSGCYKCIRFISGTEGKRNRICKIIRLLLVSINSPAVSGCIILKIPHQCISGTKINIDMFKTRVIPTG